MIRVLFVCLGNICRSPMAEAVFKELVNKDHLSEKIAVESAGTGDWHIGHDPHPGTLKILKKHDISAEGLKGRQIRPEDFERFDYIIGMDKNNIADIRSMLGQPAHPKIFRFLDLTHHAKDVPDPYFTGDFLETYELVTEGCAALLQKVKEEQFI
ncbi:protein phosphatase, low molecular weight phosphatase family [Planococcus donghaensis MPA1U2]|uniref:protein-tyrosine-phosphatase n=1 Tax=Planococcus donghaensis MPA1U2 TaxID=933115 RepID=E7RF17_9BACL|nr:low molecular weight protein-tyrosine-phosphatase [Planococcus donghaensis]EGA90416.1 protein phosphatase, low molecular weight phosphatase family [Planococcus donghaensis MPA1U2]